MKSLLCSLSARSGQLQNWGGKYGAVIKNVASNILKDAQDAEEAVSDTYLTVWNRIPPAKPEYLGAYSCRIARNLSLKRLYANTAEKRNSYYDVALDELEETIPALSTVESVYDAKELTQYLNHFLKDLSREDRYLFMRRYWYGDKINDIAQNLTKRTNVSRRRGGTNRHHHYHTSTNYYVTFEVESGDRMELHLSGPEYGLLVEGDKGKLSFQATRYLGFERT